MMSPPADLRAKLGAIVAEYRDRGDIARLLDRLTSFASTAPTAELKEAAEQYRDMHEVAGPIYEIIVDREPADARALVILANAYWLTGRGPDVVADLASRAIAADPANRGAWHLWALAEPAPRRRVLRWQQVVSRFPDDQLATANLADNAASLAAAEDDPVALKLAIDTYEALLETARLPAQRTALQHALRALRTSAS